MNIFGNFDIFYDSNSGNLVINSESVLAWLGEQNDLKRVLDTNEGDALLRKVLPDNFQTPKIGTLMETRIDAGGGSVKFISSLGGIALPSHISATINPGFSYNDIASLGNEVYNAYLSAFGITVRKINLGLCVQPTGGTPNWFMTKFEGRFVTKSETVYQQVLTACFRFELNTKFIDLSGLNYKLASYTCPIVDTAMAVIFMSDGSVVYCDLTEGSDPEAGLITENLTITSSRVMKSIIIYYDYQVS